VASASTPIWGKTPMKKAKIFCPRLDPNGTRATVVTTRVAITILTEALM